MSAEFLSSAEAFAGERLHALLDPSRSIVRQVSDSVRDCAAFLGDPGPAQPSEDVQRILLARLASDISATCALASLGYETQSLALAASSYEVGHLAGFIGFDDSLASKWLSWSKTEKMPWRPRELTEGALRNAGRYTEDEARRQRIWYEVSCLAKHANPVLQKRLAVAESGAMHVLNVDQDFSPGAGSTCLMAMIIAGVSGIIAVEVFRRQCPVPVNRRLGETIQHCYSQWNVLARAFTAFKDRRRKD